MAQGRPAGSAGKSDSEPETTQIKESKTAERVRRSLTRTDRETITASQSPGGGGGSLGSRDGD